MEYGRKQYSGDSPYKFSPVGTLYSSRIVSACDQLNLKTILSSDASAGEIRAARDVCDCKIVDLDAPEPDLTPVTTYLIDPVRRE